MDQMLHCLLLYSGPSRWSLITLVSLVWSDRDYFYSPPGWDASPSLRYPQQSIRRRPILHKYEERNCESRVKKTHNARRGARILGPSETVSSAVNIVLIMKYSTLMTLISYRLNRVFHLERTNTNHSLRNRNQYTLHKFSRVTFENVIFL